MEFEKAKVVVGGDSGVGKTALVHLICNQQPLLHPSYTIGCSVDIKVHLCKSDPTKERPYFIELWDIGGSNGHANTRSIFYQNLHGLILVYDCTNSKSQANLRKWLCDVLGKQIMKKSESADMGGVSSGGGTTTTTSTATTAGGIGGGTAFLGSSSSSNGVKVNMTTSQMASLLPIRSTENNIVNRFFSPIESLTNNNNINDTRDQIYPPVLVIGTKLDLLGPRTLRSLRRVTSRFDETIASPSCILSSSYQHHQHRNEGVSPDNNYSYPSIMMTPRSCISSVQFFEDTPQSSSSSASIASWNSTYQHQHHQLTTASVPIPGFQHQPQSQSVYVDLSDSRLSSTGLSSNSGCNNNKVWNFAAEQGFSEILLNCNSVASVSPGSPQDAVLDRFFNEVISYKMLSMSMNCNLSSPDLSRVKRRLVDSRDNINNIAGSLFNSYKLN
ncbi:unnamed protein product [Trichobilharzia szidati]|nr:unnamed protein product [Trichobilharzia szidati]